MDFYEKKKAGLGSLSIVLLIIGILWGTTFGTFCLGDWVLESLGLMTWSSSTQSLGTDTGRGIHYTLYYSLIFFLPAIILGFKFKHHWGSRAGAAGAGFFIFLALFSSIFVIKP